MQKENRGVGKKKLDLRHSWQVMTQIMFRNVVLRVNPSCGGTHAIIPWLNLLYVSNFHCVLHMFLGRIRNALTLLKAGLRECRSEGAAGVGWSRHDTPTVTLRQGSESDALTTGSSHSTGAWMEPLMSMFQHLFLIWWASDSWWETSEIGTC